MSTIELPAPHPHEAIVAVPGDKSISHRILMCAAIADGLSTITGLNRGADVQATMDALRSFGVAIDDDAAGVQVMGSTAFRDPTGTLDCGNSGSTMRMLAGLIAGRAEAVLDGDASLRRRPMERVAAPLRTMGADIRTTNGTAPLHVRGRSADLHGCEFDLPVASAQLKSALLFAGLSASGDTILREPQPSRDHTELLLRAMGADISIDTRITIRRSALRAIDAYQVPGDLSAAFFFIAGAAIAGERLLVTDVGFNPTRRAAIDVLRSLGAHITVTRERSRHGEPVADLQMTSRVRATTAAIGRETVPNLIDEIPGLCAFAAAVGAELTIHGASELRTKESDRIATTVALLRAFGARAEELESGIHVAPGNALRAPASVSTQGDHRIGMSAALLALGSHSKIVIEDAACVDTSFPGFVQTWRAAFSQTA